MPVPLQVSELQLSLATDVLDILCVFYAQALYVSPLVI